MTFYIDSNCPFCRWGSHTFRRALRLTDAAIEFSSVDPHIDQLMREHNSWVLKTSSGELHYGFAAITYAVSKSWLRWLAPLLRIPLAQRIGQSFYELITISRPFLSKLVPSTA